ncbi:DUF4810 domain-containing protein [Salinisphaera sp. Q1T1-3]|uniref:DUF4810 domain-containing protein n=1 Tax=Salinisphaera sp. Q1T1-3 TaxID=2321229 RepID=UPI000E7103E9|nr:DUF4810 domain-containing protein [Salinisphaera sp. Q1T1-3]RJS91832.1 DUF4810 domain-containing protein [Salinisphaera sp. Q1T1-3]
MRGTTRLGALVLGAGLLVLSGCATQPQPLYSWGDYQPLIYKMYVKPGEATPAEQVTQLSQHIDKARAARQKIAPGVHAQLGYMAYLDGKPAMAAEQFTAEKQLYPSSSEFMNRALARLKTGAQ